MLMIEYRSIGWWYWLATVCLLSIGVAGAPVAFKLAIALTAIQVVHFAIRERSLISFPVQVRVAFLLLLLVALPERMQVLYWVPTVGTWAQVLFGYCTMARTLSLLPWNRTDSFSVGLLKRVYFSPSVRGSVLQGFLPR